MKHKKDTDSYKVCIICCRCFRTLFEIAELSSYHQVFIFFTWKNFLYWSIVSYTIIYLSVCFGNLDWGSRWPGALLCKPDWDASLVSTQETICDAELDLVGKMLSKSYRIGYSGPHHNPHPRITNSHGSWIWACPEYTPPRIGTSHGEPRDYKGINFPEHPIPTQPPGLELLMRDFGLDCCVETSAISFRGYSVAIMLLKVRLALVLFSSSSIISFCTQRR